VIAKGAAYAVADQLTIEEFMDQGAAFGLQRTVSGQKGTARGKDRESGWNDTAAFLRDKVCALVVLVSIII
jgi:hypothetical protein